jgi:hypothetical protein
VPTGGTKTFTATVTGTTDTGVTWSVQEAGGGTISSAGVYTAPATVGTYHAVAKSVADGTKTAVATVTVTADTTSPPPPGVTPAFPGAQGGGALAKGGRGGVVYTVNTLADTTNAGCTANNNATTCSLRDCLTRTGARTCVFAVGGTITLGSAINIYNPYLTVAGQTAPGGGIQIRGKDLIMIRTHDIVWRYTRLRRGYFASTASQSGDVIDIMAGAYDIVVDHNTFMWSQDENFDITGMTTPAPKRVTVSWNLLAEPLAGHPTSALHGGNSSALASDMTDLDWHHNLIANSGWRNILASNKSMRFVNNAIYNWGKWATKVGGGMQADIIGNLYKRGPLGSTPGYTHEIEAWPSVLAKEASGTMSLYVVGNKGPNNLDPAGDNWASMVRQTPDSNQGETGLLSTSYQRKTPLPVSGIAIVAEDVNNLQASLVAAVGPYRRLACDGTWVAARDAVDARIVNGFANNTGPSTLVVTEADVGGFPTLAGGTRCADADSDGMPDAWETAHGLNPRDASDRNGATVRSPWTNLEAYLAGSP